MDATIAQQVLTACAEAQLPLTPHDAAFVEALATRPTPFSTADITKLIRIAERYLPSTVAAELVGQLPLFP